MCDFITLFGLFSLWLCISSFKLSTDAGKLESSQSTDAVCPDAADLIYEHRCGKQSSARTGHWSLVS